ncbi:hypothetical protein IAQ61_006550, partial [Plenodomus lingam]|uniref:Predicted protein n=1 Tax=Leptosphaeria maculans (strain JN3 / isolate v23.1.3 / race Av1-4-5-6-7-8) TaxID=985895 RepID=E5AFG4_LEPMJ
MPIPSSDLGAQPPSLPHRQHRPNLKANLQREPCASRFTSLLSLAALALGWPCLSPDAGAGACFGEPGPVPQNRAGGYLAWPPASPVPSRRQQHWDQQREVLFRYRLPPVAVDAACRRVLISPRWGCEAHHRSAGRSKRSTCAAIPGTFADALSARISPAAGPEHVISHPNKTRKNACKRVLHVETIRGRAQYLAFTTSGFRR